MKKIYFSPQMRVSSVDNDDPLMAGSTGQSTVVIDYKASQTSDKKSLQPGGDADSDVTPEAKGFGFWEE